METAGETSFDHEKLEVYREAIAFVAWVSALLDNSTRDYQRNDNAPTPNATGTPPTPLPLPLPNPTPTPSPTPK
jgi:hypothetical protein